jgi:hypothetical protein
LKLIPIQDKFKPGQKFNFLATYAPQAQVIALKVRALVLAVVPAAIEQIDTTAKLIGYGFDRTYKGTICVIMPLKTAVNLGFAQGAELPDPAGLLTGTGKRARHVNIKTLEEVEAPALRDLLEAAVEATR